MKRIVLALLVALGVQGRLTAEQKHDLASAVNQTIPGAGAAAVTKVAGLPLSEWAVLASIAFIVLQVAYLAWKWRRDYNREQDRKGRLRPVDSTLGRLEADE